MKAFNLPSNPKTLIFDIDSTLYTNAAYAFEQVDCQVRQFARDRGISAEEARRMVADYRKKYAAENQGKNRTGDEGGGIQAELVRPRVEFQ